MRKPGYATVVAAVGMFATLPHGKIGRTTSNMSNKQLQPSALLSNANNSTSSVMLQNNFSTVMQNSSDSLKKRDQGHCPDGN